MEPVPSLPPALGRRQAAGWLAGLLGLAALPPSLSAAVAAPAQTLTPSEATTLAAFCAALIPATDTPGAVEAGAPNIVAAMLARWAAPDTARAHRAALAAVGGALVAPGGLAAYDAARLAAGDRDYQRLKDLVVAAYYMSEAGATRELRYELVPGEWNPALPLGPDRRAWA